MLFKINGLASFSFSPSFPQVIVFFLFSVVINKSSLKFQLNGLPFILLEACDCNQELFLWFSYDRLLTSKPHLNYPDMPLNISASFGSPCNILKVISRFMATKKLVRERKGGFFCILISSIFFVDITVPNTTTCDISKLPTWFANAWIKFGVTTLPVVAICVIDVWLRKFQVRV